MKENIEVKDVQKTEYLDKNGLDMLWAKVKENTHNQVEAESNRATIQEARIIETKADKSELGNYAPNTALEALEKKISANTAAISNKQNAGNYLHYETLNNEGYYEIPSVCISGSDERTKTNISSDEIRVSNIDLGFTFITGDRIRYYHDDEGSLGFDLNSDGLKLQGGDNNHVLTSGGSTIDITEYAKKGEISAGGNVDDVQVNGVSVVENKIANIKPATKENLGVVKVGDGLNVADGTISVDTTAIGVGNYVPYETFSDSIYKLGSVGIDLKGEDKSTETYIVYGNISVTDNKRNSISIRGNGISIEDDYSRKMYIDTAEGSIYAYGNDLSHPSLTINKNGIKLFGGDNNHVLTANNSTIDITQYVLKSVYDEKIATLEARIAALEAKHAETV